MKHGKAIWTEDDCTIGLPDHETLDKAWQRIFGEPLNGFKAVEREDLGETVFCRMPNGYVACKSYPGNDAIYEGKPAEPVH